MDSPSGLNLTFGEGSTPDPNPAASTGGPRFRFPLSFDPIRLLAGVLSRWPWIVIGMILAGSLGTYLGIQLTHPSFTLSVSLIKRRVPQTVQTSETGQSYRPVDLNDATLHATLLATEPLDLALKRSKNGLDPNAIRTLVEAQQLEGTDIFYITYHSPISPEDAVAFTTVWAAEINAYTQRLQQTEAHEVRLILQNEVSELERQITADNLAILNFSKEKDYLGGYTQVAAALSKLSQIELQLETARTTAVAKQEQLKNFTDQIQRQSPIELQLRTAQEELANLRAIYTDANPLVLTKLQSIEYLNTQIKKIVPKGELDFEAYTGTPLGNQLYLSILGFRNELLAATSQIESLEILYKTAAARIAEFPAIVNAYEALVKKRDASSGGLSLMSNRLKEAEIFASSAPGYWQVFQSPDPRSIVPSSLVNKPAIMGLVGAILGAVAATLLMLLLSQRTARRSCLECCAATHAPLLANIPTAGEQDALAALNHFWITHLSLHFHSATHLLFWTPALDAADERRFWSLLSSATLTDTGKPLRIHDLTPDSLWDYFPPPDSLDWIDSAHTRPTPSASEAVLLRASSLPHGADRDILAQIDYWMALVSGQNDSLARAEKFRPLTEAYLPPCNGTLAWIEQPNGSIRKSADQLSYILAKRFS